MTSSQRLDVGDVSSQLSPIQAALRRAHRVIWQTQRPDGSWDAPGEMGATPTAQVVVSLHHLGQLDPAEAKDAARWLRTQQRSDGGFVAYPFAEQGDVGATASVWAALHVCDPEGSAEAISRARRFIDLRGGEERVIEGLDGGDLSAVYLALAGLLDPKKLPCPSIAFLIVSPLVRALQTRFHSGVLMVAAQLNLIVRRLRGDFGPDGNDRGLLARAEAKAAIALLSEFQNQDGSWNANTVQGALALPALRAAGLPLDDERITRGVAWLQGQKRSSVDGVHFHVFGSGVWSTAFELRALLAAGVSPADPRVSSALEWLVDSQFDIPQPDVDNRQPNAIRTGGWGFQRGNHTMADCDDAGVVLSALGEALAVKGPGQLDLALDQKLRRSVTRGRDWLFSMQNPDGGWSAFVWGLPGKKRGPAMTETVRAKMDDPLAMARFLFDPQPALGDPSTEDVTGRVLHGLGKIGFTREAPEVQRAIAFLQAQQCERGGWWGRWVVNDLSATAFILMGLKSVGVDMREPWIQQAVRWVASRQNDDGGWGETPGSYRDPGIAGQGPSMAPLTGLVLQGLLDAGEGSTGTVARGIEYLLRRQKADGSWPNDDYLHANVPPDTFYFYPEATKFYPAEALARYLAFREHPPVPSPARWSNAELDAARQRTDLLADKVVSAIFAEGDLAAVNAMLGAMFKSDDPIPAGLPPQAHAYFEQTGVLPEWADAKQIRIAQDLFARAGWEVAISLFCSSLPQAYAAAHGAQVLTQTGGMTKHVRQRIFETAQFVFDVLDEGGLEPNGRGMRSAQKIRLMHAAIRHLLLTREKPQWDSAKLGLPINQEDLAGTLLTFSVITLDGMKKLGIPVSEEEGEAWIHFWNVIGSFLGVEHALHARDVADAHLLMDAIRDRQWARSTSGRALIRPLIRLMEELIPGKAFDGIPIAMMRELAGDHCADLLGLPPTDWTRLLIEAEELIAPIANLGIKELGLSKIYDGVRQAIMHGIVAIEREGKHAKFRIPSSLRRSLDPV